MNNHEESLLTYKRRHYNLLIAGALSEYLEANPGIRFFQALWNLGIIERDGNPVIGFGLIIDKYNEEPEETFKKLKNG